MKEKILTREIVKQLGLDKLSFINADMLDEYTSIGDYAFHSCRCLTSVTIPKSVKSIGYDAFCRCKCLTSVTFSYGVTSIGERAFYGCIGLTSVAIPDSVTSIGGDAFCGCIGLTGELVIPNGVRNIGNSAFAYCIDLTSITITNSATNIGICAFANCIDLTSVTIPSGFTSIRHHVFSGCFNLKFVIIGDKEYETQEVLNGKCKAYKAFNADMTCRDFQYEEGKTYELDGEPILCEQGFHACLKLADVFNYYAGKLGKGVVVYEVELEGVSVERLYDSKVVAKKITIGKRIL